MSVQCVTYGGGVEKLRRLHDIRCMLVDFADGCLKGWGQDALN